MYFHRVLSLNQHSIYIIFSWIPIFLDKNDVKIVEISKVYVNRGPGSFAGIRNSLAVVKAIYVAKQIDYYCFSYLDFDQSKQIKYEDVPHLCDKFNIKKNLINPTYIS